MTIQGWPVTEKLLPLTGYTRPHSAITNLIIRLSSGRPVPADAFMHRRKSLQKVFVLQLNSYVFSCPPLGFRPFISSEYFTSLIIQNTE